VPDPQTDKPHPARSGLSIPPTIPIGRRSTEQDSPGPTEGETDVPSHEQAPAPLAVRLSASTTHLSLKERFQRNRELRPR
jgi:hypothetical protein